MGGFYPKLCVTLLQDPRYGGDKLFHKLVCLFVCFNKLELNWIVTHITSVQFLLDSRKKKTKKTFTPIMPASTKPLCAGSAGDVLEDNPVG
jgi:hypothetical protein